ncbi:MAG TPA: serine hydrolase [Parafilimonas sp.]|nr:serine hydrolase [Parafilimonas sp.]
MRKLIFILLLLPLVAAAQWKEKIGTIDSVLNYLYERHLFNGVVLIGDHGKIIYKKALGIADTSGRQLTTNSAFNLASVSKQFFVMMALILKEQGSLNFDDPVQKYLPSFPYPGITVRNLMNHTSGLPEYFEITDRTMTLIDTLDNDKALALLASKKPPLLFEPGTKFQYTNTNYTTLASIIEKVSGMSCAAFFDEKIARPLGLKNTYIYNITMPSYPASRVFGFHYENGKPVSDDLLYLDGIVGDGNIYSSAEDLYKWDKALYTEKLVKKTTFREAITSGKLKDGSLTGYGFGWAVDSAGNVAHSGGWVAFGTYIHRYIDKGQTYIFLENSADYTGLGIIKKIIEGNSYTLPQTSIITDVELIDGTGSTPKKANLRIVDDRINDIGDLQPFPGETVIDGKGRVLAPGFIDSHSHHDRDLNENPDAIAVTSQGITTIVAGQDGDSDPIDSMMNRIKNNPASVNLATYTGFGSLRYAVMKNDLSRTATAAELDSMKQLLTSELQKGSFGLSTGLEYEDQFYSSMDEVIEMAKTAAASGGRYISHIRSEDINLERSIDEIIQIGKEAKIPVQISHFKIAMVSKWGTSDKLLAKLEAARADGINITADCYPYTMWSSTPRVLFPKKDFTNYASAEFAVTNLVDPGKSVITHFSADKNFEGKSLTAIGALNNENAAGALLRIIKTGDEKKDDGNIIGVSMSEPDIINFLKWDQTNLCSDGADGGHPRGYGAFTRFLGRYVRDQKIMPLETAIHKITALTAEHLGIRDRGILARNYYADMVLFDPATVIDNATIENPKALSTGIEIVWVNGKIVYQNGQATKIYPGVFIKGHETDED